VSGARKGDEVTVRLSRNDLVHAQWVLALERPVLPFLAYTSVGLILLSLTGIWPAAGAFVPAALLPLVVYLTWVPAAGRLIWRRVPGLDSPRTLRWDEAGYSVEGPTGRDRIRWGQVEAAFRSRRILAIRRQSGALDLVPTEQAGDDRLADMESALSSAGVELRTSRFL